MKWGTLRATVVERGRRRRAWTRERREFYRAHCLVFPTAAVDFSAHAATCAAAATGRLPPPSATPLFCPRVAAAPPVSRRLVPSPHIQLDSEGGGGHIDCPAPKRTTWRKSKICMFGVWGYWFSTRFSDQPSACVRACVMLRTNDVESVPENIFPKASVGGGVFI